MLSHRLLSFLLSQREQFGSRWAKGVLLHDGQFFMTANGAPRSIPRTSSELLLESLYVGLLGGSAVAVFFLAVDLLDGRPLFTPSLLGSVMFQGATAQAVVTVQLGAVFYFSLVHMAAFTVLGGAMSLLVHEVELHSKHPIIVLLVLFACIETTFFVVAPMVMPGVIATLGMIRVAAANLLAAGTMALFFVLVHNADAWHRVKHSGADLAYDSFYSGALGGSAVALFFLAADVIDGQPLFTPSLIGSVVFFGAAAEDVVKVDLGAVAYLSAAHMIGFVMIGAATSWLVHEIELHSRHPIVVLFVVFSILEVSFFVLCPLVLPGVIDELGILRIGGANLFAALTMAVFFMLSHREDAWRDFKHAIHLT
jgi:hypothetical protein